MTNVMTTMTQATLTAAAVPAIQQVAAALRETVTRFAQTRSFRSTGSPLQRHDDIMSLGTRTRTRTRTRTLLALLACVGGVALVAPAGPVSAAALPQVGAPSPNAVAESVDYASDVLSDPWDFSNAADIQGPATIAGGLLTYVLPAQQSLVGSIASSQPWGRDGRLNPANADRYTRLSLRLWSSATSAGGVSWARCSWATVTCRGFQSFMMQTGWHTYDLTLKGSGISTAPAPWGGQVVGLRLTGAAGPTVKVDWARLHDTSVAETMLPWTDPSPGRPATVYWDSDANPLNNTPDQPGWGVAATISSTASSNSTYVSLSALPPGTYRFYVVAGATTSTLSAPVIVRVRPRPVILSPSAAQGTDYATSVRKDPWDMAQRTDFRLTGATLLGMNGLWFAAQNTGNDPNVYLPMPKPFLGSTFHRVQVHVALLGSYGLGGESGGGCVGRLMWTTAQGGPTKWQTTDDLVLYPGWNAVTVDMATSPSSAIVDPVLGVNRIGWAGQSITALRFDPNEDPGPRRWFLDDVRVETDPASSAGTFSVQFSDLAGLPGTTASVEAVGTGGQVFIVASGRVVQSGVNTVAWHPGRNVPVGTYRIRVVLSSSAGSTARWASVPLRMTPA